MQLKNEELITHCPLKTSDELTWHVAGELLQHESTQLPLRVGGLDDQPFWFYLKNLL